jgi:hypothetical protein
LGGQTSKKIKLSKIFSKKRLTVKIIEHQADNQSVACRKKGEINFILHSARHKLSINFFYDVILLFLYASHGIGNLSAREREKEEIDFYLAFGELFNKKNL